MAFNDDYLNDILFKFKELRIKEINNSYTNQL